MRPLLQHASRSLIARHSTPVRSFATGIRGKWICQQCAVAAPLRTNDRVQWSWRTPRDVHQRSFSSSTRWQEDRKPLGSNEPIAMPPPPTTTQSKPAGRVEDHAPEQFSSLESQERWQEDPDEKLEKHVEEGKAHEKTETVPEHLSAIEAQERLQEDTGPVKADSVPDNVARVPDEHLPSHRERQRWDLSKRLNEFMDELLPKLAIVTQKVNTYTGTDYSGVEALRREIKEQETLVKNRRLAIDTCKQSLDTALAHQASAQKEVVTLLERKHSWSATDLERYMALIRSEHINDQAVRQAKDAVANAENSLEEARSQLEKRERAQYHEEQIWSDTIRRNSTWVTFGLMGVNIFLLLLSLAIIEPWRRRRMVREIKNALEAHKIEIGAGAAAAASLPVVSSQGLAAIEEEIDRVLEVDTPISVSAPAIEPQVKEGATLVASSVPTAVPDTSVDPTVPGAAPLIIDEKAGSAQERVDIVEEISPHTPAEKLGWTEKISWVAQDIISDRVISIRRIDYTTAVLQGAAAGAVITAAIIAMARSA